MKIKAKGKPITGSKSPSVGYFYVLLIMGFVIFSAIFLTGGFIPVDPNSPDGPPTLPPYYNSDGTEDEQKIFLPTMALTPDPQTNLQLKTFKVNVCGRTSAIDILVDTSGSMTDDNKLGKLKDSLKTFTENFSKTTAVAIQTFSAHEKSIIDWGLYKNNKTQVQEAINDLDADGHTVMRDGFKLAKTKLNEAITQNKFPGYNYSLLLISDGVPEEPPPDDATDFNYSSCRTSAPWAESPPAGDDRICHISVCDNFTKPALRCFIKKQDPRESSVYPTSNIATDIKNLGTGVSIYAIGLYADSSCPPADCSDNKLRDQLEQLLEDVVSPPVDTHYYPYNSTSSTEDLKKIFDDIVTKICEEQSL